MGLCCCKGEDLKNYKTLYMASKMKRTTKNKLITGIVITKLGTRDDIQRVIENGASNELKVAFGPPFSDFDRITHNIYLTGTAGMVSENIIESKITYIINVSYEIPNYKIEGIQSIRVPVDDDPEEDLFIYFDDVSDKLNDVTVKKGRAVVHCFAGRSRSTTFVLAYLMKYKKMNLKEAFILVRHKRPIVHPNSGFFRQLIDYEKLILGQNSTKIVRFETKGVRVMVPDLYLTDFRDLLNHEVADSKGRGFQRDKLIEEFSERSVL